MSDSVFRTAESVEAAKPAPKAPEQPKGDGSSASVVHIEDLAYTYQDEMGHPLTAEYFDVPDMWDRDLGLKADVQKIEEHIKAQIKDKKLANTPEAAKKYLKTLEKKAEVDAVMDSTNNRIEKVHAYIDFLHTVYG